MNFPVQEFDPDGMPVGVSRGRRGAVGVEDADAAAAVAAAAAAAAGVDYGSSEDESDAGSEPEVGLGRIVALCCRPSTSYQIHGHIRCLYIILKRQCDRTLVRRGRGGVLLR